jgi:hypothetical protein
MNPPPPEMHIGAPKLLPAWFVGRMTDSIGDFAFLLTTGDGKDRSDHDQPLKRIRSLGFPLPVAKS